MKIGFYSPYFDSLSGGERYVLTLAAHWSKLHDVSLFWDDPSITRKAQNRFGLDLSRVSTVSNVFKTRNIFSKLIVSRSYDLLFFLTDGSIPTTFAKHNILHVQEPFQKVAVHAIKLDRYQVVVCNSDFTKRHLDKRLGAKSQIIYPPVPSVGRAGVSKKNIILSVGRFHHLKKQDVLLEAFRKGVKTVLKDYSLVLIGSVLPADQEYLKRLQTMSKTLPVNIVTNAPLTKLKEAYNDAKVYWHATGYRATNPQHMEHFGISTVEAMSAGSIPVVFSGGGLPEIVSEGQSGFLWANTQQLLEKTAKVITSSTLSATLSRNAKSRAKEFTEQRFTDAFDRLLETITT